MNEINNLQEMDTTNTKDLYLWQVVYIDDVIITQGQYCESFDELTKRKIKQIWLIPNKNINENNCYTFKIDLKLNQVPIFRRGYEHNLITNEEIIRYYVIGYSFFDNLRQKEILLTVDVKDGEVWLRC